MKDFDNLTYYELLEIPANASFVEIRHAYRDMLAIYNEDSLSTYALFSPEERESMLELIEKAFHTLVDEHKRSEYDRMLMASGKIKTEDQTQHKEKKSIPIFQPGTTMDKGRFFKNIKEKIKEEEARNILKDIHEKDRVSGKDLKKLRKALGIELQEIFEIARISVSMLQAIEDNDAQNLPAQIYLKNFLTSYAEILQLDPKKIIDGYIVNLTH